MRRVVLALMVLGSVVGVASPARAQPPVEEHCVMEVVGQATSGELILAEASCYPTFKLAMKTEGVGAWGDGASTSVAALAAATFTIGTHYDLANYGGSSTSVVGTECAGGWLNTSATWNNRISSTRNGCPRIRHYAGTNLTGAFQTTTAPGGNLTALNNLTSSIQYNP